MKLNELMPISDSYTDEVLTASNAIKYANEAVAFINTKLKTSLPFFSNVTTDYTALSESWARRLFVPYLNYSVKMNDASLTEAAEYKQAFMLAFVDFQSSYLDDLDEEYQPENLPGVYMIDTSDAIDTGFFGSNRGGGL